MRLLIKLTFTILKVFVVESTKKSCKIYHIIESLDMIIFYRCVLRKFLC
jgi:hypothetical protein